MGIIEDFMTPSPSSYRFYGLLVCSIFFFVQAGRFFFSSMACPGNNARSQLQNFLFKEVLNIVQTYFELKMINVESTSLFLFLRDRVHELFHYFLKQAYCCNTNASCASIAIKGTLTKDQFDILFENDPSVQPTHEKKKNGRIVQHCICPLSPNRAIDVTDLDFTLINCLIKTCRVTPAGHPQWLKNIIEVRNCLSHPGDQSSISGQIIQEWWKKLEDAAVNMAGTIGVAYKKGVQRRISEMETSQSQLDVLVKALKTRDDDLIHQIIGALQNLGVLVGEIPFQITATEFVKEKAQINLASSVSFPDQESNRCIVAWNFSNPGNWDVEKMKEKLDLLKRLGDFDIEFVYIGSLVIYTQANVNILSDEQRFKESIEEFLFLFVQFLKIQSPISTGLDVTISIGLPRSEVGNSEDRCQSKTATGSIKEDKHTSSVLTAEENERSTVTVTKSIEKEVQTSSALSVEECHTETVTKLIEEVQTSSALSVEEDEHHRKTDTESNGKDKKTSSQCTAEDDKENKRTEVAAQVVVPKAFTRQIENINLTVESTLHKIGSQCFGCCILADGRMAFTNYRGKVIRIFSTNGTEEESVDTPGIPFDVTQVNDTTLAISCHESDFGIHLINTKTKEVIKSLLKGHTITGLTVRDKNHLIIGESNVGIRMIHITDETLTDIVNENLPIHSYVTSFRDTIIHTNWKTDTVTCHDINGKKKWSFKDETVLRHPLGIATDRYGNVFVVGHYSHNLLLISADGGNHKEVKRYRGDYYPLDYDKNNDKLLFAGRYADKAEVMKLS